MHFHSQNTKIAYQKTNFFSINLPIRNSHLVELEEAHVLVLVVGLVDGEAVHEQLPFCTENAAPVIEEDDCERAEGVGDEKPGSRFSGNRGVAETFRGEDGLARICDEREEEPSDHRQDQRDANLKYAK